MTVASLPSHGYVPPLFAVYLDPEFRAALDEARTFLSLPMPPIRQAEPPARRDTSDTARRLFAASKPVFGTLAERWFRQRGIALPADASALRFHPRCYYRGATGRETWPALIAAVTHLGGAITGVHRTWLHPGGGKAPVDQPRRALGALAGNAVRFGSASDVLTAAEGIETALALKMVMPKMPVAAALSSAHLAALVMPSSLRRLYVAVDNDAAGAFALERLRSRCARIEIRPLAPRTEDFNADLLVLGPPRLRAWVAGQLAPGDAERLAS
jgi:hypothetical protein